MKYLYVAALLGGLFVSFVAITIMYIGSCYNGCSEMTDYLPMTLAVPFVLPSILALIAIVNYAISGKWSKWHAYTMGAFGALIALSGIYMMFSDPGDREIYITVTLASIAILLPGIFALYDKATFDVPAITNEEV